MTLLTQKSPEHTIVSIEITHFHYKLIIKDQFKVKLADFYFCASGTNGLSAAPAFEVTESGCVTDVSKVDNSYQ